jgi:predicted ATP-dependent endonuclease of OLD family
MKLKEIRIKNFRGFKSEKRILVHADVTGITGRNDVGKSTILEALDIFFPGGETTIDKDDFNVSEPDSPVEIRCIFDQLPTHVVIDESNSTTLEEEHLLNSNGDLEILKRYRRNSKEPSIFIVASHPTTSDFDDLHTLKISDLKKRAKNLGLSDDNVTDARMSASWRAAIWSMPVDLAKQECELEIGKFASESKTIQDKLFKQLPLFALFKSDRESKDNDPLAKNPLQNAVSLAKEELSDEINKIQNEIQRRVLDRAKKTLEKLEEMEPALASQLVPRFRKPPTWSFDFSLDGEDDIPINKRGSGVRRLILLNFFRAEAERKVDSNKAPSVIYAFEEPETSQHPSNQEMLVRALIQIGQRGNCQVLVTTHVPALAGLLPVDGLRFIQKNEGEPEIRFDSEDVLYEIADSLGVLPDPNASNAKGLLLVEGAGDIVFVRHAAIKLKEGGHIPFTLEEKGILPVIIGGCGNLKHWRTKKLADQFGIPWATLLDSDLGTSEEHTNRKIINELKSLGKKAYVTKKRETENYILPEVVNPFVKVGGPITYTDIDDAKTIIAKATIKRGEDVLEKFWQLMTTEQIRLAERYVDDDGLERFELTEILTDLLTLVS